jgi:hypothetical protein
MAGIEITIDSDDVLGQIDTDDLVDELCERTLNHRQSLKIIELLRDNLADRIKIGIFIENMDNFTIDQLQSFANNL